MAYRPPVSNRIEEDNIDTSTVSLASIVELQSNRRKGNATWRIMQAKDLGQTDSVANFHFRDSDGVYNTSSDSDLEYQFDKARINPLISLQASSARAYSSKMPDDNRAATNTAALTIVTDKRDSDSEAHFNMRDTWVRLSNSLPDPTRLSEQMGKFDGQVMFIGHPNRDISAHQWSLSSFQWVNIGHYSHSHGKVEGSLASDRLRGIKEPYDTLEYFKLAAMNRESLILDNGRPKPITTTENRGLDVALAHTYTDTPVEGFRVESTGQSGTKPSLPLVACDSSEIDVSEDPFVTMANAFSPQPTKDVRRQAGLPNSTGSLDLTYRFPTRVGANTCPNTRSVTSRSKITEGAAATLFTAPTLREVAFDEQAAARCGTSDGNGQVLQFPSNEAGNRHHNYSQLLSNEEPQLAGLFDGSVARGIVNAIRYAQPIRPVTPSTHTPPSYGAVTFPCSKATTVATYFEAPGHDARTGNAGLQFSDPDVLRTIQRYDVANDLNQQAPTRQCFKGPFLTETQPTTQDLTVALSVRVSEEEKLVKWFHDGHRPARQREYTKSLMATAAASNKIRRSGITKESCNSQEEGPYANTAVFVRLYENLSEYVEEYRNGSGQSYFTRRWKPAASQLRGFGSERATSFFSPRSGQLSLFRPTLLRPSERMWAERSLGW